jgi:hypothetical protein
MHFLNQLLETAELTQLSLARQPPHRHHSQTRKQPAEIAQSKCLKVRDETAFTSD